MKSAGLAHAARMPRARPRVMVAACRDDAIRFQECNPKEWHTAAWHRYEKYKVATTVGDALNLGAKSVDIKYDLNHRFATKNFAGVAEASLHAAPQKHPPQKHPPPPADHLLLARSNKQAGAATASLRAAPVNTSTGVDDELTQDLQTRLQTERSAVLRLEGELEVWKAGATSKEREIAELRQSVDAMKCEIAKLKQSTRLPAEQHQGPAGIVSAGPAKPNTSRSQVIVLALSACAHVESRCEDAWRCEDARAWVAWMGEHLPCAMLQQHSPRVLAALVLHAAWCMEWGDGFPFTKCIVRLVECTRSGRGQDLAFPQRAPLWAMQFLKLSAAECGKAAEAYSQLVMSIGKSSARGLPGRPPAD